MDDKKAKDIIREELKKLSALSWGERLGYIWDYYKPLMVAVILVIAAISMGVSIYRNIQQEHILQVYFINSSNVLADAEAMAADFAERIDGLKNDQVITIDTSIVLQDDGSQYSMASQMKMAALTSANEIDIMVVDEATFEDYYEAGVFADLSKMLSQEQLERWTDRLVEKEPAAGAENPGKETVVAALDLSGAPVIEEYNLYNGETLYGGIFFKAEYSELYGSFFEFLMQE